jgi:hypothetical protein
MPRIAPLSPPYPPKVQASFDSIMPPGAEPLVLFRTLATSERHWRKFRSGSLLDRGPLCAPRARDRHQPHMRSRGL